MAKASPALQALRKAEREAKKNIRVLSEKALQSNLEAFCGDDVCEAYRQGVHEAQHEILSRMRRLVMLQQSAEDKPPVGKPVVNNEDKE